MDDVTQSRTASVAAVLLGGWLMLSPIWISITGWALTSLLSVGAFVALMGIVQLLTDSVVPSVLIVLAAIWLAVSAYVFNVSDSVIWNEVASGIGAFLLGAWDGIELDQVHQHRPHVTA